MHWSPEGEGLITAGAEGAPSTSLLTRSPLVFPSSLSALFSKPYGALNGKWSVLTGCFTTQPAFIHSHKHSQGDGRELKAGCHLLIWKDTIHTDTHGISFKEAFACWLQGPGIKAPTIVLVLVYLQSHRLSSRHPTEHHDWARLSIFRLRESMKLGKVRAIERST